jgi:hypothetical protein
LRTLKHRDADFDENLTFSMLLLADFVVHC